MKIVILGSGTSHGVPVAGCECKVCKSNDPRDKRTRCSVYIEGPDGERVIIDAGPEFRLQAIKAGIRKLDAVFLTHSHADHIHGLDDVRPYSDLNPLPVYGNAETIAEMKERFSYAFNPNTQIGGGKPKLIPSAIKTFETIPLGSLNFTPYPVKHGNIEILSWYITETEPGGGSNRGGALNKGVLFMTDTSAIDSEVMKILPNPEILIIGGLRIQPHVTHFSFEQALETGISLKSGRIYLTHICHKHFHTEIEDYCREFTGKRGFFGTAGPAWDGMELLTSSSGAQ